MCVLATGAAEPAPWVSSQGRRLTPFRVVFFQLRIKDDLVTELHKSVLNCLFHEHSAVR